MSDYKLKVYGIIAGVRKPGNIVQTIHAKLLGWLGIARPSLMMMVTNNK